MMYCQFGKQTTGHGCKRSLPLAWLQQRRSAIKTRLHINREEVAMGLCKMDVVVHVKGMMHQQLLVYSFFVCPGLTYTFVVRCR